MSNTYVQRLAPPHPKPRTILPHLTYKNHSDPHPRQRRDPPAAAAAAAHTPDNHRQAVQNSAPDTGSGPGQVMRVLAGAVAKEGLGTEGTGSEIVGVHAGCVGMELAVVRMAVGIVVVVVVAAADAAVALRHLRVSRRRESTRLGVGFAGREGGRLAVGCRWG